MSNRFRGYFYVMLSAVMFGCMPLLSNLVYAGGANPICLVFFRAFFSLPTALVLMRHRKDISYSITKCQLKKIVLLALGASSTGMLLSSSYNYIASGMATSLHFVYPVCVLLVGAIFFNERVTPIKVFCFMLSTIGIFFLYSPKADNNLMGIILAVLSGNTYAFYILWLERSGLKLINPLKLSFYLELVMALIMLPVNLLFGTFTLSITPEAWLSIIKQSNIFLIASILFQIGVREIGGQGAALLSTLEPITSIIIGILVFHEPFKLKTAIGAVLILTSVLLLTKYDVRSSLALQAGSQKSANQ